MHVKTKILFVNSSVSGGGAGRALVYLVRALKRENIESIVALPFDGVMGEHLKNAGASFRYIPSLPERFGKTQFTLPSFIRFGWVQKIINVLLMPYFAVRVAYIARKEKVDLICSNHQFHVPICAMAGYISRIPVAIYSREYLQESNAKIIFRNLASMNVVKRVFTISHVAGKIYQGMDKLELLHDSYDFNEFEQEFPEPHFRKDFNVSPDAFVFGFLGRIIERKGVDLLIKAFQIVQRKYPETILAIVGGNDPGLSYDLIGRYKKLVDVLNIGEHVRFTGFQKDIRKMAKDFDVCVMPSLDPEPFGLVYLESVICKVPCLVPDNSGAAEVVTHGKNGNVFKAKDVNSLAAAMCEMYEQRDQLKMISEQAYNSVKNMFDTSSQYQKISDAFRSAISDHKKEKFA